MECELCTLRRTLCCTLFVVLQFKRSGGRQDGRKVYSCQSIKVLRKNTVLEKLGWVGRNGGDVFREKNGRNLVYSIESTVSKVLVASIVIVVAVYVNKSLVSAHFVLWFIIIQTSFFGVVIVTVVWVFGVYLNFSWIFFSHFMGKTYNFSGLSLKSLEARATWRNDTQCKWKFIKSFNNKKHKPSPPLLPPLGKGDPPHGELPPGATVMVNT